MYIHVLPVKTYLFFQKYSMVSGSTVLAGSSGSQGDGSMRGLCGQLIAAAGPSAKDATEMPRSGLDRGQPVVP